MTEVAARDLRNDTAGVLRRVESGEQIVITVRGKPVAQLLAVGAEKRAFVPHTELLAILDASTPDPTLRADMKLISGAPEDLQPIV